MGRPPSRWISGVPSGHSILSLIAKSALRDRLYLTVWKTATYSIEATIEYELKSVGWSGWLSSWRASGPGARAQAAFRHQIRQAQPPAE